MPFILLTSGIKTLVDDTDYESLSKFKWRALPRKSGGYYAYRTGNYPRRMFYMHREIMKATPDVLVDHKDGDTLNNQRANLRTASKSQNAMNSRMFGHNTSGVKGVCWSRRERRWRAHITIEQKMIGLGYFRNKADAVNARLMGEKIFFGEFARQ